MAYTRSHFAATVQNDFANRQRRNNMLVDKSVRLSASAALEARSLGHPDFEHLQVGERRTEPMVAVFLDLTNFTGRTFWDPQEETVDLAHAVLTGFIEIVNIWGGHPLGLRGDGLFAGFNPGGGHPGGRAAPEFSASMALGACAFALDAVENGVNPWLVQPGRRSASCWPTTICHELAVFSHLAAKLAAKPSGLISLRSLLPVRTNVIGP